MTVYTPKQYAEHLAGAGKRLNPLVVKTMNRAAMNIKVDWRKRAEAKNPPTSASAKYPSTIVQRKGRFEGHAYTVTVETLSRGQGALGSILEHGGAHNAPQRSNVAALQAELPNLRHWLGKIAKDAV